MTTTISTYEQQAIDFLNQTNTSFQCEFIKNDFHFVDDKEKRDIYKITLRRGQRKYSFEFGQSLVKSQKYADKLIQGREYTTTGSSLKGSYKIIDMKFAENYCKLIPGTPPTSYDVLACLQKSEIGTFDDFCNEFGYDTDSRKAYKIYKAVKREWENIAILFTDAEIELLQEIQ